MSCASIFDDIATIDLVSRTGRVRRILPTYIEADGPAVARGAICSVEARDGENAGLAEVVGIHPDHIVLAPFEPQLATYPGALVQAWGRSHEVPVGDAFLGRAVDAFGRPIDEAGPIEGAAMAPLGGRPSQALDRVASDQPLETGVRAIDTLLTLGRGQRVGVFAAAGVGKTSLLTQLAGQMEVDRCVVCLVGERGREVEAFWSKALSPEAKARSVLVAATSDQAAAMRVRAGQYAVSLADYWRAQGQSVLLLLDSATRLAMALREVGLAAGEPPTVRAYTPGVFAAIPRLVEQCGALRSGGSVTAVMTVLAETDEVDDPISEMMKSLLDGHIVLSRRLAEQGHFPAIDAPRSISRLARDLTSPSQKALAQTAMALLSTYEHSRALIETGVYARGASSEIDRAIDVHPGLMSFLRQPSQERVGAEAAFAALADLVGTR